jgi:phosphoribosylaminoimidazole (AIR) synthetase
MKQFINFNNASLTDVEPVFNLGVGMMAVASPKNLQTLMNDANDLGLQAHIVGNIQPTAGESRVDFI